MCSFISQKCSSHFERKRKFNIKSSFLTRAKAREWKRREKKHIDKLLSLFLPFLSLSLSFSVSASLSSWVSTEKSVYLLFDSLLCYRRKSLDDVTQVFVACCRRCCCLCFIDFRWFVFIFFLLVMRLMLFMLFAQAHSLLYHHPISESIKMNTNTSLISDNLVNFLFLFQY